MNQEADMNSRLTPITATAGPIKPQIAPPTGDNQQLPFREKKRLKIVKRNWHESDLIPEGPF